MSLEDRLAGLEGERMAEVRSLLENADADSDADARDDCFDIAEMTDEEIERLATGDASLSPPLDRH